MLIIFFKDSFEGLVPFDIIWLDFLLLGVILLAILQYRPQGLFVEKPTATIGAGAGGAGKGRDGFCRLFWARNGADRA